MHISNPLLAFDPKLSLLFNFFLPALRLQNKIKETQQLFKQELEPEIERAEEAFCSVVQKLRLELYRGSCGFPY